jgi:hypothetical protein
MDKLSNTLSNEQDKKTDDSSTSKSPTETVNPDPTRYGDWEQGGRCIDF